MPVGTSAYGQICFSTSTLLISSISITKQYASANFYQFKKMFTGIKSDKSLDLSVTFMASSSIDRLIEITHSEHWTTEHYFSCLLKLFLSQRADDERKYLSSSIRKTKILFRMFAGKLNVMIYPFGHHLIYFQTLACLNVSTCLKFIYYIYF